MSTSLNIASQVIGAVPLVIPLNELTVADLAIAGAKAVNLGRLISAGLPVPPGFVLTTRAYDEIVARNQLDPVTALARAGVQGTEAQAAFSRATLPADLEQEIVAAYRRLGGGSVAVRSSATAEDLPGAAFAGQHETLLGIADEVGLLKAVRSCWASLWSERAIAYRQQRGLATEPISLAVIVQRMVPAESAGVLFTANPVTGARNETVIDATSGLGEALVSGLVTPDHFVLRRGRWGWRIVERRRGQRDLEMRTARGGGIESVAARQSVNLVLGDDHLRRLAKVGEDVVRLFGSPQDIEWALASDHISLLQARPITALPHEAPRPARKGFAIGGPTEYFQVRPYPLDMTSWVPVMFEAISRMLPLGNNVPSFQETWIEEDGVAREFAGMPSPRPSPSLLMVPLRMIPLAWRNDPAHWRDDPILLHALQKVRELESRALASLDWAALLATASDAMTVPFDIVELRRRYFPRTLFAMGGLRLLLAALDEGDRFGVLLSGVDNRTLEANRRLEAIAAEVRRNPSIAADFAQDDANALQEKLLNEPVFQELRDQIDAFLAEFGHRETVSPLLISQPTWKDSPEIVLGLLKTLTQAEPPPHTEDAPWRRAAADVLSLPIMRLAPLEDAFIALLEEARRFPALREDTHFLLTLPVPILRRVFLEMGRRLTEIEMLREPSEVFHLRFAELEHLATTWPPPDHLANDLRQAVASRAEKRASLADVPVMAIPARADAALATEALVSGMAGSPGITEGPVRLVRDVSAFGTVQPGDVMVAPYTNPSWTPLFRRAAAVIVDAGSSVSHAAIVAREYGIPAVMGTGNAMKILHDGQRVIVDGTRGLVFAASAQGEDAPA